MAQTSTVAIIGDVHAHFRRLEAVLDLLAPAQPDLLLLVGDVGRDPPRREPARSRDRGPHDVTVAEVLGRAGERLGCPFAFVPGNHDLPVPAAEVAPFNLDGREVEIAGLRLAGFGGAGPARFGFPYEWSEREAVERFASCLGGAAGRLDVLVCHTPPLGGDLDRLPDGAHVGSRAVREWIERLRPRLFVCGHIHESWGVEEVAGVPCLNAGALGEPYGQQIGWIARLGPGGVRIEQVGGAGPSPA